ncbi:MAG: sugar phosphate nucleotidyltransferase [Planctomycetota bacterium]
MSEIRRAVIPLAGRGTRLAPLSRVVPKGLLPMPRSDGRLVPLIQLLVEEVAAAGLNELIFVVPTGGRAIFEPAVMAPGELSITFAEQHTPRGLGDAILSAREAVGDERFLMILGDHAFTSIVEQCCSRQLVEAAKNAEGAWTAVTRVGPSELCGVAALRGVALPGERNHYRVEAIREKPSLAYAREHLHQPGLPDDIFLGHFGMHVFPPEIFSALDRLSASTPSEREVELTAAQEALLGLVPYHMLEIDGERHDTGIPQAYLETMLALGLRTPFGGELAERISARL